MLLWVKARKGVGVDGDDEVMGLPLPLDKHRCARVPMLLAFLCGWQPEA